ncbi:MAG: hypothetical protein H5U11_03875, partial [Rhizobium sp.]|nr:hypothetical protein [Rhizobium sp.]
PPALQAALASYNAAYSKDYAKALKKYDGKIWYDPTEAERKALVANQRKGHDLAYAPTGSALKAGKLLKIEDAANQSTPVASATAAIERLAVQPAGAPQAPESAAAQVPTAATQATPPQSTATAAPATASPAGQAAAVPVPQPNPLAAPAPVETAETKKKPFWKIWQSQ